MPAEEMSSLTMASTQLTELGTSVVTAELHERFAASQSNTSPGPQSRSLKDTTAHNPGSPQSPLGTETSPTATRTSGGSLTRCPCEHEGLPSDPRARLAIVDRTGLDHVKMIGVGPEARQILETSTPDTELAGMVIDWAGRSLWLGPKQRLANAAQRFALAGTRQRMFRNVAAPCTGANSTTGESSTVKGTAPTSSILLAVCLKLHEWLETENLVMYVRPTDMKPDHAMGQRPDRRVCARSG